MVSGRSKAYTSLPAKDDSARDTSEFMTKVTVAKSRPAKFSKCGQFLTEGRPKIPLEDIADTLFDCETGLQTPVLVECFHDKTLKDRRYAAIDIGGQDIISHVRMVLGWTRGNQKKVFTVYNPHEKTIETLEYSGGQRKIIHAKDEKK